MRNTPLWRPQPSSEPAFGLSEESSKRFSVAAIAGLGLAIAVGVGAIGAFTMLGDAPVEPAVAAVEQPVVARQPETTLPEVVTREPLAGRIPASLEPAAPETIDVAVAHNDSDVARLEEMTGMVAAVPETAPEQRVTATIDNPGAISGLRNGQAMPGAENVVVQPEPNSLEDRTETASIRPDETLVPSEERPAAKPSAAVPALPKLSATKVTKYVNLRSGPADESRVITVVPAGATVQSQSDCGWCVVTYKSQRGYIYKSFLSRVGGATASNDQAPAVNNKKPGLY